MIPPGARYDPIGPPGVPGFEPERFQPPRHPMQPGMWPGMHPDLQQMPGQGMGFPNNHPDLPPHRGYDNDDDMFM
jgi:proteasome inhibitor subunit 1 (PI31)